MIQNQQQGGSHSNYENPSFMHSRSLLRQCLYRYAFHSLESVLPCKCEEYSETVKVFIFYNPTNYSVTVYL